MLKPRGQFAVGVVVFLGGCSAATIETNEEACVRVATRGFTCILDRTNNAEVGVLDVPTAGPGDPVPDFLADPKDTSDKQGGGTADNQVIVGFADDFRAQFLQAAREFCADQPDTEDCNWRPLAQCAAAATCEELAGGPPLAGICDEAESSVSGCPPLVDPCLYDPCNDRLACNGVESCAVDDDGRAVCSDGTLVSCDSPTVCTEPAGECVEPLPVVISFLNNADLDERLIAYLESSEGGNLQLSPEEKRSLRPRVRLRVQVTFVGGETTEIEFVSGTAGLIDARFEANTDPDFNQNGFDNAEVHCDVMFVELAPGSDIEVFVPVELNEYSQQQVVTTTGQEITRVFQLDQRIPPRFRALELDAVDENGIVVALRNIDPRDVIAPVVHPFCGSVIAIEMRGTLSVPFLPGVDDNPSYDGGDQESVDSIGGRFEFIVTRR